MNIDDLLGKLLPLFEKKMAWSIEKEQRSMSLAERTEQEKTDLEYRKLEAQITSDKDKLKWEKDKLVTTIKGGYDLEVLKNSGMMDQERLKNLGAKERVEIDAASKERIAKGGEDAKIFEAKLRTIPEFSNAGTGQRMRNAGGSETITDGSTQSKEMGMNLGRQTGIAPAAETAEGSLAGEQVAMQKLTREQMQKDISSGNIQGVKNRFNSLDAASQQRLSPWLKSAMNNNVVATPAPGVAPASPVQPAMTAPNPGAVTPAAMPPQAADPVRNALEPTSIFQKAGGAVRSVLNAGSTLNSNVVEGVARAPERVRNAGGVVAGATAGAGRDFLKGMTFDPEQEAFEKAKKRALLGARGLNVGGF